MFKILGRVISRFFARYPYLMFFIQNCWYHLGHRVLDIKMATWVIRRPEWLGTLNRIPHCFVKRLDCEINESAICLAARIQGSYSGIIKPQGEFGTERSIWTHLLSSNFRKITEAIIHDSPVDLASKFVRIFQDDCVNGFCYGTTFNRWPHRWHYLPIQVELSVVQLAEAVGVLRAECHEQGETRFWSKLKSAEQLIDDLETFFGFRVEQPSFGSPTGSTFGGRFLTRETCSHLHSAYRMSEYIRLHGQSEELNIVEIGGGYGGLCYWMRKVLGERVKTYTIIDLPSVSMIQAYFLSNCFPSEVAFPRESLESTEASIRLLPTDSLEAISFQPTVIVNQDSMPEMPSQEVTRYLYWISRMRSALFLSFNQETYSVAHGCLQNNVAEMTKNYPNMKRICRNTSWDRRGYVEEVYQVG